MALKNRSVPVDTVLPHVSYQNLGEAMAWLTKAFGFQEYYRYGEGPSGGQMWAGKTAIQVRQAGSGQRSPAQLGYGTQSLTVFVDDVDEHHRQAKAAGVKIVEEPHKTEYGEYQYAAQERIESAISPVSQASVRRRSLWFVICTLVVLSIIAGVIWRQRLLDLFRPPKVAEGYSRRTRSQAHNPEVARYRA